MSASAGRTGTTGAFALVGMMVGNLVGGGVLGTVISMAFTVAGGIVASKAFPIKTNNQSSQDLYYGTAVEATPIPVILGPVKLSTNQGRYDLANMRVKDVEAEGGKGGSTPTGQQLFFCSYEQILCMGPIDGFRAIYSVNSGDNVLVAPDNYLPAPIEFGEEDFIEIELKADNEVGGLVRVYRGSPTQTRISEGDPDSVTGMNYRDICYMEFMNFCLGYSKAFPSFAWVPHRWPRAYNDDGQLVGMEMRGSLNPEHPHYWSANPAAALWEAWVDQHWGAGRPAAQLDMDSFLKVANQCAANNWGVALPIDQRMTMRDLEETIAGSYPLKIVPSGGKLKLVNLGMLDAESDVTHTMRDVPILAENEFEDELDISQLTYEKTFNLVQTTWTDPRMGYRDTPHNHVNQANILIQGQVSLHTADLRTIQSLDVAIAQTERLAKEVGYPALVVRGNILRTKWGLEPGDLCSPRWRRDRKLWETCNNDEAIYTSRGGKWMAMVARIVHVGEGSSTDDTLKITAREDYHWPRLVLNSVDESVDPARYFGFQTVDPNLIPRWDPPSYQPNAVEPVVCFEVPAVLSEGEKLIALLGERTSGITIGMEGWWKALSSEGGYSWMSQKSGFAVTGHLLSLPKECSVDLSAEGFTIQFTDPKKASEVASSACKMQNPSSVSIGELKDTLSDYIIVGNEIIQVGYLEPVDTAQGIWRVRNYIRGLYNTEQQEIPVGDTFAYVQRADKSLAFLANTLPDDQKIAFRTYPVTIKGKVDLAGDDHFIHRLGEDDMVFKGTGNKPLCPESATIAGDMVHIRPRFIGNRTPDEYFLQPPRDLSGQRYLVEQWSGGVKTDAGVFDPTWVPGVVGVADTGIATIAGVHIDAVVTELRIYTIVGGKKSVEALKVPVPVAV